MMMIKTNRSHRDSQQGGSSSNKGCVTILYLYFDNSVYPCRDPSRLGKPIFFRFTYFFEKWGKKLVF